MNGLDGGPWYKPDTVVQLYAAPYGSAVVFVPIGDPVPLGHEIGDAGYWDFNTDLNRAIAFAEPGEAVLVQVRGWELSLGSTFENATMNSDIFGFYGMSGVIDVELGTEAKPSFMVNDPPRSSFGGFGLFPNVPIPEASSVLFFGCGCLLWTLCRRHQHCCRQLRDIGEENSR